MFVLRYTSEGRRDKKFGHHGMVIVASTPEGETADVVKLQPDNKLLVVGQMAVGNNTSGYIFRKQPYGRHDATFDGDGHVGLSFGEGNTRMGACEIQPDGKIVIAGHFYVSESGPVVWTVARLNGNGSFDSSFDGDGKLTIDPGGAQGFVFGVAIQADGKIIIGGSVFEAVGNPASSNFLMMRRNIDGTPDTGFGQMGRVQTNISPTHDSIRTVRIQPDGKVIAGGGADVAGNSHLAFARYLTQ